MNSMYFIFSLLLASCMATAALTDEDLAYKVEFENAMKREGITPFMLESNIIAIINDTLNGLPTEIQHLNLTFSNPNQTIVSNGALDNVTIVGMDNHIIDGVKFGILPLGFAMHLNLAGVSVSGLYDIDALLLKLVPIYGNGLFTAGAEGVDVAVTVDMTSTGGFLSVTKLTFTFTVKAVTVKFENLLGGDLGSLVGEVIEDKLPEYIDRILYYYGDNFRGAITSKVNAFLSDKTVNDLLDWIKGVTTAAPATTVATNKFY